MGVDFLPARQGSGEAEGVGHAPTEAGNNEVEGGVLATIKARHDASCPHCTSTTGHTQTVFGEGNPDAEIMFIGEAPGVQEDRTGRPFVGPAGEKLDEIITAMGLSRDDVYIANVLKSRPPQNRTPLAHEIQACGVFLHEQITAINPRVIVALGSPATKFLLETAESISRLRGIWSTCRIGEASYDVLPTFHPAYLLRNYTQETRRQVWEDMKKVITRLSS
jgi:uracil-DNA glycosylase family 4